MKNKVDVRLIILVFIISISGFSQGMLLPLIAIIFEQDGVSSTINGIHATSIYIGILLISPFMEKPMRKFGFKPIIIFGGMIVILSLALFPLWKSILFWFILRLLIGIGDNLIHFGTQTWITSFSPINKRGRNIAFYGLSFGVGFALGPLMAPLLKINEALPFIISSLLSLFAWGTIFFLKNEHPANEEKAISFFSTFKRFGVVSKYAWAAFLPPFCYGFLEATLNGNFPVFALRIGIDVHAVAIILPAFAIGSILFQLPLGMMSDYFGRKKVLIIVLFLGSCLFVIANFQQSVIGLSICFLLAGMALGSTYSLGITYMADLLPRSYLPAGNIMISIFFSIGSIIGPFIGGVAIEYLQSYYFLLISTILFAIFLAVALFKPKGKMEIEMRSIS